MTRFYFICSESTEMQSMIRGGDEEALLAFVKENPGSSTVTNNEGWTSLHEAAYFGQLGCLKILIESETSVLGPLHDHFQQIPSSLDLLGIWRSCFFWWSGGSVQDSLVVRVFDSQLKGTGFKPQCPQ